MVLVLLVSIPEEKAGDGWQMNEGRVKVPLTIKEEPELSGSQMMAQPHAVRSHAAVLERGIERDPSG